MPIVAFFTADQCPASDVVAAVAAELGLTPADATVLDSASARHGVAQKKLLQAMTGPPFVFDSLTHKRARYVAWLRGAVAESLASEDLLLDGFATHLLPREIGHALRVCLLADPDHRAKALEKARSVSRKEAERLVRDSDAERHQWTRYLFGLPAWDRTLYDLKIPVESADEVDEAARMVVEAARSEALRPTAESRRAVADFQLAARAGLALVEAGIFHGVAAKGGEVVVTVDEYVLRLDHLEEQVRKVLAKVDGMDSLKVKTGPNYRPPSVFSNVSFELPEKVLLVDDERDFVLTLSERLQMRDLEPAIASDGAEALRILKEEEPDVMVLDLKMPGVDGIEVLRRVKAEHPEVEVIILTGHGDQRTRELCLELGAFAYLEKPVDIEVLSDTMKQANERIRARKSTQG